MKKSLKLYTDIFDTQWSDSELLKRVSIVFVSSFVGTIVMFFVISLAFGGFNYTHALLNLLRLEDSVAVFLLFSAALLQMSGWVIMLQIWHKIVFRTWFGIKNDELSTKKILIYGAILAGVLFIAPDVIIKILDIIGVPDSEKVQTEFLVLQYPVFTLIFFPIIGMFEEVFFRGILQNLIMKNLSNHTNGNLPAVLAILSSSLIFTALHAFQYGVKVLIVVFALSLILGSSYAIFKSLKLNMFAHMLNNIAGVIAILITSGSLGTTKIIAAHDMDNLGFNVFVKSQAMIIKATPYEIVYNPYYSLDINCIGGRKAIDKEGVQSIKEKNDSSNRRDAILGNNSDIFAMNDKIKVTTDTQEKERITKERDILVDKKNGRAESFGFIGDYTTKKKARKNLGFQ